jgi:hypothetical protein
MAGVEDLVQRTGDGQAQVGYSVAGRSGGRLMPCVVYTVHMEMRSTSFLVESQNQGQRFPGLGLQTGSSGLVIWTSKSPGWFPGLGLKIGGFGVVIWASKSPRRFLDLGLKTKQATVC